MRDVNYVSLNNLRKFAICCLEYAGLNKNDSLVVADCLLYANLRGIDSHGIIRLNAYIKRILKTKWEQPEIINNRGAIGLINGNNMMGPVSGKQAVELAVEKAKDYGIGIVGVNNSNHFGAAAYYSSMIAEAGMIGFAFSNSSPRLAPWGGIEPILGNNPWSYAFPTKSDIKIILDISNSITAVGKIREAALKDEQIPYGWATDKAGEITQNPHEAIEGLLLPIGEHKGYGITLTIDLLSGVLTGAQFANKVNGLDQSTKPQNMGHLFGAINIEFFLERNIYESRVEEMIDIIKKSKSIKGNKIFLPGEIEYQTYKERIKDGIPLHDNVISYLNEIADKVGVDSLDIK